MASSPWSFLRLAAIAIVAFTTAVNATHPLPLPTAMKGPVRDLGARVPLESALAIEYSVMHELAQLTGVPPIPFPTSVTKDPKHKALERLAAAMPPVQANLQLPDAGEMLARLMPPKPGEAAGSKLGDLSERSGALRIMIVGDSISQGQQGDWTWRYRLYQWLQSQNVDFTYVGPYTGTFESSTAQTTNPQPPQPPPLSGTTASSGNISVNGGYAVGASQAFLSNSNHFTNWGRAVATDQYLIEGMLNTYPADLVLVELGFNDMGWFYSDCYGTLNSMENFIANARASNPNVKFAIANVPQRTFIRQDLVTNISTYNSLLPQYVNQWSTSASPVYMVDFEGNYDCGTTNCPAGYDGLHPNAWGEYQIANAFSKALIAGYKIGQTALAIPAQSDPSLVRSLPAPSNFQVFSSPQGVSATWNPVYGAYSYSLQVSINGGGSGWSGGSATVNRFDSQWPAQGWVYAVSVAATCGDQTGSYTSTESATAEPQLAAPPSNVVVQSTSEGINVSWDPPTGQYSNDIVEYNVLLWDTNPSACQFLSGVATKGTSVTLDGLEPGANYFIAPLTWNSAGQGWPNIGRQAIPGGGVPGTPTGLQVISNDPTSVHVTWNAVANAAGYELFLRNATGTGPYTSISNTTQNCNDDYFLFPGTWTYEFAVAAWNGNDESSMCAPVVAPRPASTATEGSPGPTCAPAPPWCPNSGSGGGGYVGGSAGGGSNGSGGGSGGGTGSHTSSSSASTITPPPPPVNHRPTSTYSSPPASSLTPLCAANTITPQMWDNADIGGWLNYTAENAGDEATLLQAVVSQIPGYKEWECTLDGGCTVNGGPWDNPQQCDSAPQACIALFALVNWGNMIYAMNMDSQMSVSYLNGEAGTMVNHFWPQNGDDSSANDVIDSALSLAGTILGLVPVIGDGLSDAADLAGSLLDGVSQNPENRAQLAISNITGTFATTGANITGILKRLLDGNLNSINSPSTYMQKTSVVQLVQSGEWANPTTNPASTTSDDKSPEMVAALASVPINWLWSQADSNQIVTIKASNTSLGFNPCLEDEYNFLLFNSTYGYCDLNGNIYVIQSWATSIGLSGGAGPSLGAVPGIFDLPKYNISSQYIIPAAEASQARGGIMAPPMDTAQAVESLSSFGNGGIPLQDILSFNLPYCDLDTVDPGLHAANQNPDGAIQQCQSECQSSGGGGYLGPNGQRLSVQACQRYCTWYGHMYCECWQIQGWPYRVPSAPFGPCNPVNTYHPPPP